MLFLALPLDLGAPFGGLDVVGGVVAVGLLALPAAPRGRLSAGCSRRLSTSCCRPARQRPPARAPRRPREAGRSAGPPRGVRVRRVPGGIRRVGTAVPGSGSGAGARRAGARGARFGVVRAVADQDRHELARHRPAAARRAGADQLAVASCRCRPAPSRSGSRPRSATLRHWLTARAAGHRLGVAVDDRRVGGREVRRSPAPRGSAPSRRARSVAPLPPPKPPTFWFALGLNTITLAVISGRVADEGDRDVVLRRPGLAGDLVPRHVGPGRGLARRCPARRPCAASG